jgi:hypothetical protein
MYYIINELPLYEGFYTLSTAIYDYDNRVPYDHHDRMYSFEVKGRTPKEKRGGIEILGKWHIKENK